MRIAQKLALSIQRPERFQLVVDLCRGFGDLQAGVARNPEFIDPYSDAIRFFEEMLRWYPHDMRCRNALGQLYGMSGEVEKGLLELTKCVEAEPANSEFWRSRGFAYMNRRAWDEAIGDFSRAIELDSVQGKVWQLADTWNHRAKAYANKGQINLAAPGLFHRDQPGPHESLALV